MTVYAGAHLAMLAIASQPDGTRIAIAIGTRADDQQATPQWFACLAEADVLENYFDTGLPEVATLFDISASTCAPALMKWFGAGNVGISDGDGADLGERIGPASGIDKRTKLWIDRITRVHFYSGKQVFQARLPTPDPLARFDTAGIVVDISGANIDEKWAVSRLQLEAEAAWPNDPATLTSPIKLKGISLVCHIPVAVNAHEETSQYRAKRYDTRVLLFADASRAVYPSLWTNTPEQEPAFSRLDMLFSDAGIMKAPESSKKKPVSLSSLAGSGRPNKDKVVTTKTARPLFACFAQFNASPPSFPGNVERELGLRRLSGGKLVLRCELNFSVSTRTAWPNLWDGLIKSAAQLDMPNDLMVSAKAACLLIAQEQLAESIKTDFGAPSDVTWLFTVRVQQEPRKNPIEKAVIAAVQAVEGLTYSALRQLRPETGMSAIPLLSSSEGLPWHAIGRLVGPSDHRTVCISRAPKWPTEALGGRQITLYSFEPRGTDDLWLEKPQALSGRVVHEIRALTLTDHTPLKTATASLSAWNGESEQFPLRTRAGVYFKITAAMAASPTDRRIRLGAFEFGIDAAGGEIEHLFGLSIGDDDTPKWLKLDTTLPIRRVTPVAQDQLQEGLGGKSDPDRQPLLLGFGIDDGLGVFELEGIEEFGEGRDQRVSWTLSGEGKAAAAGKLLIIDPQPFRVAAIEYSIGPPADGGAPIASWEAGKDGVFAWHVLDPQQTVRMLLPPQIVGEAMEKNTQGIADGEPAAARFGSLTRIDLDPTFRDTSSREAGWNLRRMLNRIGDSAPGALIRDLRFEIAYGLLVRHVPQRETWLAEMAAIIGKAPDKLDSSNDASGFIQHSNDLLALQAQRLAVDKVWAGRPEDVFQANDGLTFSLRTKAADPAKEGIETAFCFPVASGYPSALPPVDPADKTLLESFAQAGVAQAFPGGVPWAFESANILREVYANPVSNQGRIGNLYFSALGGWGQQRAQFAQGKSVIETETDMGRMSYYKLERLGRISGSHNRAKHVIVYRRTVVPSAQFYNDEPIGLQQTEHAGRPILRKVEEYVDILQPERRYPEQGSSRMEAGACVGTRFISRRILVDSNWGGDVRNEGWKVPLWREQFAGLPATGDPDSPASLYRKPLIQMIFSAQDGGETGIEVKNPQRLFFYTSTTEGETGDNIDEWHAVEGCDFCDAVAPVVHETSPRRDDRDLHDGMLPGAPRDAGGHRALTLDLVDTQVAVCIAAGRVDGGPACVLKNVTLSRAMPKVPDTLDPKQVAGIEAAQLATDTRARLDRLFAMIPARFEALARELAGGKQRAKQAVMECKQALEVELQHVHEDIQTAAKALQTKLSGLQRNAYLDRLEGEMRQPLDAERKRLFTQADAAISRGVTLVLDQADTLAGPQLKALDALVEQLSALKLNDPVDALNLQLNTAINEARDAAWRLILLCQNEARDEISAALQQLHVNVEALERGFDQGPEAEVAEQIRQQIESIKLAAVKLDEIVSQSMLDTEAEALRVHEEIESFIESSRKVLNHAQAVLDKVASMATVPAPLRHECRQVDGLIRKAIALLDQLSGMLAMIISKPGDLDALKRVVREKINEIKVQAENAVGKIAGVLVDDLLMDARLAFMKLVSELHLLTSYEVEQALLAHVEGQVQSAIDVLKALEAAAKDLSNTQGQATQQAVQAAQNTARQIRIDVRACLLSVRQGLINAIGFSEQKISGMASWLRDALKSADVVLQSVITDTASIVKARLGAHLPALDTLADRLSEQIVDSAQGAADINGQILAKINEVAEALIAMIDKTSDNVDAMRKALEQEVAVQTRRITDRIDAALDDVQHEIARQLGKRPGDVIDGIETTYKDAAYLYQQGDNVLRMLRAVGDPPKGDTLGCNRPEVAYVLNLLQPVVDITPSLALANRTLDTVHAAGQAAESAGRLLESFGVRLPLEGIGEHLIPASLKGFSLARLFPDMGGIDLEGLLKKAGFPDLPSSNQQGVRITRGFDKDKREAWLQADIDVRLDRSEAILDFGPVSLMIDQGHFRAETRMAMAANGQMEKSAKGQIAGDWRLVSGGMDIITFEQTPLLFDQSGRLDFKIASDRVRLAPSLEFLTNLMANIGKSVPPGVEPVMRNGMPVGLVSKISMALPPIQTGAFGITDLTLGVSFGIIAQPEFEIVSALNIASRDAPFTLAVWLLNGGGYIAQRLAYRPMSRPLPVLTYTLDIAIVAGVGIGFGFGVVSGGVWLQIGCSVALTWTTGRGGNVTTVTAFMLARGNVDIAGLVTANISLRLEISYDGAVMIARGTLRLSFRISMFYTLRVSQGVEYRLAGERAPASQSSDYSDSFG